MTEPLLRTRGLSKSFGALKALDGVEVTLRGGEIHALMGENGAGKSTLIKVLTGVYPADGGEIQFEGRSLAPGSPRDAEEAGISTVYQEINLIPTLSIADNITLGRQPTRFGFLNRGAIRRQAETALQRLGLELDVTQSLGSISIAQQQLVAIARALDVQAKLLILDEPTSSLDEREVEFLFGVLRRLRAQGMGLLFVTHFLDQVYAISDRITVLRNGTFVGEYPTAELPRLQLIEAMLGRRFAPTERSVSPSSSTHAGENLSTAPLLEANGVGRRGAMNPLNLSIAPAEVVGLAGLLGSGRTETAKMLFGILPPDQGHLRIQDQPASIRSPRQAIQLGMAFCSEDRKGEGICPHLSVRENLVLAMQASRGLLSRLSHADQERLAAHYIQALKIKTTSPETPIGHLSGGNQQKVLLARWLLLQPKLLMLDEPTRGIDVGAKAEIEKLIRDLQSQGMSVLLISSDLEETVRTCQRVIVLRDRRKIGELSGEEVEVGQIMNMIAHHEQ